MNTSTKCLLVYPEIPKNTYWSFEYSMKFINKKTAMPPLGLITVAAMFPPEARLKLVDMNIESLSDDDIEWADAVFISAMIVQKKSFDEVVMRAKKKGKTVVAGGPYPTNSMDDIQGVDHFVLGEVEESFANFFNDLAMGKAEQVYAGGTRPDMCGAVLPRFDLLKMDAYASMSVQYSRGCPFKCEFCDIWKNYGNKPRLKPKEKMIQELDALYALGWEGPVFIVDDNFIGNKVRVKRELLPALIDWQKNHDSIFRFYTEASINMAGDEDLLCGMKDAGFNEVFIGIETPSAEALKETGKVQNLKTDLATAVNIIQKHGIEVMAGFILGFDSDKEDIFQRQIQFIQEVGIPKAMIGLLNALPGTDLYLRMEKEGRLRSCTTGNNTHSLETNFVTKMDPETLKEGYKEVLASIYDPDLKNYFTRCNTMLDNLGDSPFFQRKVRVEEIIMLIKSLAYQSPTPYGLQYLKFISRNLFRHFRVFGEAVRLSIEGHHFYTITRELIQAQEVNLQVEKTYMKFLSRVEKEGSMGYLDKAYARIRQGKTVLKDMRKRIDRLNGDFREELRLKYAVLEEKAEALVRARLEYQ